jgi:integrase
VASTQRLASGKWRARYRDEAGREHAKHFVRKIDAQQWLDEVTAALVTGQYVDPRAGKITLRQYASGWEALQVGREGTAAITDNALRVHILPLLGDRTVASLRRSDIQGLVKTVSGRLAPSTVRNVYDVLNRVLAAAVDDRVISVSPAKRIALPALTHGEVVPPSSADVAALAEQVNRRYRGLVVLLAGGGLRIGEALGLRISDVDFLRRQVWDRTAATPVRANRPNEDPIVHAHHPPWPGGGR